MEEQNRLYMVCIDLEDAYDEVLKELLLKTLENKIIQIAYILQSMICMRGWE